MPSGIFLSRNSPGRIGTRDCPRTRGSRMKIKARGSKYKVGQAAGRDALAAYAVLRRRGGRLEEAVPRPRQAEILAQRLAGVLAPEDAAALQLRHHAIDEVVEPAR